MNNLDLIKQLEDLKYHCQDFAEDEMEKEIQPFTDDVKALDQAINELRWIPVEKELPETRKDVLICIDRTMAIKVAHIVYGTRDVNYDESKYIWWTGGVLMPEDVIAWRPLPKPYERKE